MKKRLFSMLIAITCAFTAALPASANDASLSILGYGQTYSTGLLQGNHIGTLIVHSFSGSSDEIYYEVTDQNGDLVVYGWLQPKSSVYYDGYSNSTDIDGPASFFVNYWNTTPTTDLNLTMVCSAACDASGYIDVY